MSQGNSRSITTNQQGPHEKIPELVNRHLSHSSLKPYSQHTLDAFDEVQSWLKQRQGPIILDACCGVGESTARIAAKHPDALVVGVDKSALRTGKHSHYQAESDNYIIVRADLNDFWRLALDAKWVLAKQFLLYPNPYPKSAHVQRRWHASAAFGDIVKLGGLLEVRSNWKIYIEEFAMALNIAGFNVETELYQAAEPDTPFERKYWASGQQSWRVVCDLSTNK
ncbi:SAM-dependent methyltransferase [Aestuariibacter sp. AA17]|uniref:tRNA (guanine(46)-N(7))-methyltransferase n=1 Tax=Fluctibacter corallii TaxID=2984329 RepID=A0ABT3AAG0_9ALTE|nr:SAM-dependent methyltransferase [Aestuariibacter sp. AA17]MCV2885659.1 SAM-dependent methyltransferase [Aestuariibacter sp. AA17]